jgi:hypothetical protein
MQLLLSFAQRLSKETEPNIWLTLHSDQRNATLGVLVRLLAKAAAASAAPTGEKEHHD